MKMVSLKVELHTAGHVCLNRGPGSFDTKCNVMVWLSLKCLTEYPAQESSKSGQFYDHFINNVEKDPTEQLCRLGTPNWSSSLRAAGSVD